MRMSLSPWEMLLFGHLQESDPPQSTLVVFWNQRFFLTVKSSLQSIQLHPLGNISIDIGLCSTCAEQSNNLYFLKLDVRSIASLSSHLFRNQWISSVSVLNTRKLRLILKQLGVSSTAFHCVTLKVPLSLYHSLGKARITSPLSMR